MLWTCIHCFFSDGVLLHIQSITMFLPSGRLRETQTLLPSINIKE